MYIIAIDPGITSGIAVLTKEDGQYIIKTYTIMLDKEEITEFLKLNSKCRSWVLEKPCNYSPMAEDAVYALGYWCAMIDAKCLIDADFTLQTPKQRELYLILSKKFARRNHEKDAVAQLLKYVSKYPEIYKEVVK